MELSIIIVSYNTKDFLRECLDSIKESYADSITENKFEIIVVDNASKDGTQESLNDEKHVTLIKNKENLGFSKANNIGVKESKGEYILFLNPDTVVNSQSLPKMVDFMEENKDAGAVTCKVLLPNGKLDDASHRGFPTPWNALMHFSGFSRIFPRSMIFNGYHLAWKDPGKDHEIDALAGACMMVRREAGDSVGWWSEDYFFYGEDIDFCYELKEKGWKIFYITNASILHYKGVSSGIKGKITTADKETREKATKWRFDAMKIFYDKHYVRKYPGVLTSLVKTAIDLRLFLTLQKIKRS